MTTKKKKKTIRQYSKGWKDLYDGSRLYNVWSTLSFMDYKSSFSRYFLGALWLPLGNLLVAVLLGFTYGAFLRVDPWIYSVYLLIGLTFWQVVSASLSGSYGILVKQKSMIENLNLPLSYYIYRHVCDNILLLLFSLPIMLCASWYLYGFNWIVIIYIIPILFLYAATSFASTLLMAIMSLRVRDLDMPLTAAVRVLFLVTPVIWSVEALPKESQRLGLLVYNPFYHYLEIARQPFLGEHPQAESWTICISLTIILLLLSVSLFAKYRDRIYYWI